MYIYICRVDVPIARFLIRSGVTEWDPSSRLPTPVPAALDFYRAVVSVQHSLHSTNYLRRIIVGRSNINSTLPWFAMHVADDSNILLYSKYIWGQDKQIHKDVRQALLEARTSQAQPFQHVHQLGVYDLSTGDPIESSQKAR